MRAFIWRKRALGCAREIIDYIADCDPVAAERLAAIFESAAD